MRINDAATKLGVSRDWLRDLEERGLIPAPRRDRNGHRRFSEEELQEIQAVILDRHGKEDDRRNG